MHINIAASSLFKRYKRLAKLQLTAALNLFADPELGRDVRQDTPGATVLAAHFVMQALLHLVSASWQAVARRPLVWPLGTRGDLLEVPFASGYGCMLLLVVLE